MRPSTPRSPAAGPGDPRSEPELVLAGRGWANGRIEPIEVGLGPDGTIVQVGRTVPGRNRHDVGEGVILPSGTDLHVHFREPGPSGVEGFASGTLQAALGGIGLVGEMPNTVPPVTDPERWAAKAARARGRLAVDAFLYGAATLPAEVRRLAPYVAAFKLYLSPTTGIPAPPAGATIGPVLEAVDRTGLALSVHAELPERFRADPKRTPADPVDWDRARPGESETDAMERLLSATPAGVRLHLAHLTLASTVERLSARGGVCSEATPHHLLLSARVGGSAFEKVNPPLRSEAERAALWQAFRLGRVPVLASDHAPHALEEKERPFYLAPSGLPGVETMLPLMLERVREGGLDLATLVRAACDRPARWIGSPRGRVAVGHRANLIVVDFRRRRRVEARHLHAPCGWSAFEGWPAIFPIEHYLEGRRIVEDGEFVGDSRGSLVRPEYAREATHEASAVSS